MTIENVDTTSAAPSRRFGCLAWQLLAVGYMVSCLLVLSGHRVAAAEQGFRTLFPSGTAPHPVVLLVPGCSGFAAKNGIDNFEERARELQTDGYVVVFVDYLGRRMATNCAYISLAEVAADIFEAAASIQGRPGIDTGRISVIGWSYGGGGVLATSNAMPSANIISKAVMYYPVCRGAPSWSGAAKGLMLLGRKDDIANPDLCDAVAKGVPTDSLRINIYPEARHGFDMRGLPEPARQLSGAPAYNAEAAKESWIAVLEFLK